MEDKTTKREMLNRERAKRNKFAKNLLNFYKKAMRFDRAEILAGELEGKGLTLPQEMDKKIKNEKNSLVKEAKELESRRKIFWISETGAFESKNAKGRYAIAVIPFTLGLVTSAIMTYAPKEVVDAIYDFVLKFSPAMKMNGSVIETLAPVVDGFGVGTLTAFVVATVNKLQKRRAKKIDIAIEKVNGFIIENEPADIKDEKKSYNFLF